MSEKHAAHHAKDHEERHAKQDAERHPQLSKLEEEQRANMTAQRTDPPKVAPRPANQSSGLCIECGKPTAPGQNEVCEAHMRGGNA